jgi:hypothetical protein
MISVRAAEYKQHTNSYTIASTFVQNKGVLDAAYGSGTGRTYLGGKGAGIADRDYEVIVLGAVPPKGLRV